jgi:RimJ/RimL family protein N-acetyltransferase
MMLQLIPEHVSPALRALFDPGEPGALRYLAVLEGDAAGRIFTDDPIHPTWGLLQETTYGTIFLGGIWDAAQATALINQLRGDSDVLIGLWPEDERFSLLPSKPEYEGHAIDFTNRLVGQGLESYLQTVPEGCTIRRVDAALFERCVEREGHIATYGSVEKALENLVGFCLLYGDDIACEAFAGPATLGIREMGVETREAYRGRGYATLTCAHLIHTCEEAGYQTYWNTARQNVPSIALARKLGYRSEKEYRLLAWFKYASEA